MYLNIFQDNLFNSAFLKIAFILLCNNPSTIPATVNTPPIIAQIYTKKWKNLSLV